MTASILRDQNIYVGGYNLTTQSNTVGLDYSVNGLPNTAFGDDTESEAAGLKTVTAQAEGFYQADPIDDALFNKISVPNTIFSICNGAQGERAFTFKSLLADYTPFGNSVGELARFKTGAKASKGGDLIRGVLLYKGTITADGESPSVQLPTIADGRKGYLALHMFNFDDAADDLSIEIRSDASDSFVGGDVLRATLNPTNAIGTLWQELTAPTTNTYWRAEFDVTGATPAYDIALIMGIQ